MAEESNVWALAEKLNRTLEMVKTARKGVLRHSPLDQALDNVVLCCNDVGYDLRLPGWRAKADEIVSATAPLGINFDWRAEQEALAKEAEQQAALQTEMTQAMLRPVLPTDPMQYAVRLESDAVPPPDATPWQGGYVILMTHLAEKRVMIVGDLDAKPFQTYAAAVAVVDYMNNDANTVTGKQTVYSFHVKEVCCCAQPPGSGLADAMLPTPMPYDGTCGPIIGGVGERQIEGEQVGFQGICDGPQGMQSVTQEQFERDMATDPEFRRQVLSGGYQSGPRLPGHQGHQEESVAEWYGPWGNQGPCGCLAMQAIRVHHAARGHDKCWENDVALYRAVGLEPGDPQNPPIDEHCRQCDLYRFRLYGSSTPTEPWISIRLLGGYHIAHRADGDSRIDDGSSKIRVVLGMYGLKSHEQTGQWPKTYYHSVVFEERNSDFGMEAFTSWWNHRSKLYKMTRSMKAAMAAFRDALVNKNEEFLAPYRLRDVIHS